MDSQKTPPADRILTIETLWLGVWERNPRAIPFCEKVDFVDRGSHDFFVASDRQTDRVIVAPVRPDGADIFTTD